MAKLCPRCIRTDCNRERSDTPGLLLTKVLTYSLHVHSKLHEYKGVEEQGNGRLKSNRTFVNREQQHCYYVKVLK